MCRDEDENDAIECDINTGKIIIQEKKEDQYNEQDYDDGTTSEEGIKKQITETFDEESCPSDETNSDGVHEIKNRLSRAITHVHLDENKQYMTLKDFDGEEC